LGLVFERIAALFQFLPAALVFREGDEATQISFCQTVELLTKADLTTAQVFLACLQLLR